MQKPAYILFDLDSTLYPVRYGLEKNVSLRVNEFISGFLGLSLEDAWALRKERLAVCGYGTTLEWLAAEHGMEGDKVEAYFSCINPENEADSLAPDGELAALLHSINLPKAVLTNSAMEHAVRVLKKLGVLECFTSIFDIRFNKLKGKPSRESFYRPLEALGVEAGRCLFVDDVKRYVEGYRALGGPGVYYDELDRYPEFPAPRITRLEEIKRFLRDG